MKADVMLMHKNSDFHFYGFKNQQDLQDIRINVLNFRHKRPGLSEFVICGLQNETQTHQF